MKTLHWYFPWATALHLYNMTGRGEKLQQLHCYHPFSDFVDIYLTKSHDENYYTDTHNLDVWLMDYN